MNIILVAGCARVFSWADGVIIRREATLIEEFRRNPEAVFERLYRAGETEMLEYLIEHFL